MQQEQVLPSTNTNSRSKTRVKLSYQPSFCPSGKDPYETVNWHSVHAKISGADGTPIFEQEEVEAPTSWSHRAVNIVAQKYFRGTKGTDGRETSVRQVIERVVSTIKKWAEDQQYFSASQDLDEWADDLRWLLLHQHGSFNSPVWFNLGVDGEPQQASACFIQSVEDDMASIAQLQTNETLIFKQGSGTGTNFSTLRSSLEPLSGGGRASGPISFMRGYDTWAGGIKSGGKTRRSAKMAILNISHPDVVPFIQCKVKEEKKAHALIDAGFSPHFDDPEGAYASVHFQNANHSVRVTNEFMNAVVQALETDHDATWNLYSVRTDEPLNTIKVLDLWREICVAVHTCGDPGLQFDDTINQWNTCANDARINASNPCGEFMFLDDSACNLASLNIRQFEDAGGKISWDRFGRAVECFIIAQEAMVSKADYPTKQITHNSHQYRPLGIGFSNLGAHLMANGIPYDSEEGRQRARQITSYMTATAYAASARLSRAVGPFAHYKDNLEPMLRVIGEHWTKAKENDAHADQWEQAFELGKTYGYRNSQVSLLAPTGTISFMMDCDTTGVEPEYDLYKVKTLAGGGEIELSSRVIEEALTGLGYPNYSEKEPCRTSILAYLKENKTLRGSPLRPEHLPVFQCAVGALALPVEGHLNMLGAVQPFLSGAVSKTVNMNRRSTIEEMGRTYIMAWQLGIKNVALYRDGSKEHQPLNHYKKHATNDIPSTAPSKGKNGKSNGKNDNGNGHTTFVAPPVATQNTISVTNRVPLPDPRDSKTKKFNVGGVEGYITVGMYEDGKPGEVFLKGGKEGALLSGLLDSFAIAMSMALQHGCDLNLLLDKLEGRRFEPSGWTEEGWYAKSIVDYLARWMKGYFIDHDINKPQEDPMPLEMAIQQHLHLQRAGSPPQFAEYAPTPIPDYEVCQCGGRLISNGRCKVCSNCGTSEGGCS